MEYCGYMKNIKKEDQIWMELKYHSDHGKHRHKLNDEPKKQTNRIFINDKLAIKVIMDYRTTSAHYISV